LKPQLIFARMKAITAAWRVSHEKAELERDNHRRFLHRTLLRHVGWRHARQQSWRRESCRFNGHRKRALYL
jgi:hypothetical protein